MAAIMMIHTAKQREFRRSSHIDGLNDHEMLQRYRFTNNGVNVLVNLLEDDLRRPTRRNYTLTPREQILLALRFLATGSMYQVIGDTMGFHKGTVSRAVDSVISALLCHIHEFLKWQNAEQKKKIAGNFYRKAGFPNVIGCIDGTQIRIQAPTTDEVSYVNRKGYHSISVQAVCDDGGMFTSINASWPGSCHDSHVFRTSGLCRKLETENRIFGDGVLLGDSRYPCRPFLMTPFLVTDTTGKTRYQESHTKTRVVIERTFGQLKRRFHVLHSEIRLIPQKVCKITMTCAILHNLAHNIMLNEPDVEFEGEECIDFDNGGSQDLARDGATVMNFVVQQYFL